MHAARIRVSPVSGRLPASSEPMRRSAAQSSDYDRAYQRIRARILKGQSPPGTHLNSSDLAREMGLSRISIQPALWRLHGEGLVKFVSRLGAHVRSMQRNEYAEFCGLRHSLNLHALEIAVRMRSAYDLEELGHALASLQQVVALNQLTTPNSSILERWTFHHARFHRAIIWATGNEFLKLETVRLESINRTVTCHSHHPSRMLDQRELEEDLKLHECILDAITKRAMNEAKHALENHDDADFRRHAALLENLSEYTL